MNKYLFIILLMLSHSAYSQLLPGNQPEQNPCGALEICGTFYTPYSYSGIGSTSDMPNTPCGLPGNPCGEDNVVWFKLNITSSGTLVFRIVPSISSDDYDWALVNATGKACHEIAFGDVIRCNFNTNFPVSLSGQTGLNMSSSLISVPGGTTGNNYCRYVDVTEGEVYYLMVNNFGVGGAPTSGFNLSFEGSTATFNTPPPPSLQSVISSPCNHNNFVTIKLDRMVKCSSIASNGSDFILSPSGSISSAVGIDCGTSGSGFTDEIRINFSTSLPQGDYTLKAKVGTDGNTLLNLCDIPLELPDSLQFNAYKLNDTINLDLCASQLPYTWNGMTITSAGWGPDHYSDNIIGCDSVTKVFVSIVDTVKTYTNLTICSNQLPYVWNGISITSEGFPAASKYYTSTVSCDSMSYLNLTVTPPKEVTEFLTLCSYELPYNWNDIIIPIGTSTNPNHHTYHTVTSSGCDSFTTLNLTVHNIVPINNIVDTHACGSLTYKEQTYYSSTVLIDTISAINGCDSVYMTLNIFVHNNVPLIENNKVLGCDSVTFRGITYYSDTVITDSFFSIYGCDSLFKNNIIDVENFDIELYTQYDTIVAGERLILKTKSDLPYTILSWAPLTWFPNQYLDEQYIFPTENLEYIVTAQSQNGCIDTSKLVVSVVPLVPDMLMPNAFSPNGDGLNDEFAPIFFHETGYRINYFMIYDRWGNLVYKLENSYVKGWDGTYSTKDAHATSGVYYYIIDVEFVNGQTVQKKGDVTLLR